MKNCVICNGELGDIFNVKEMMLGLGKGFQYRQCNDCKTIQIVDVPVDIVDYYPEYYYSFKQEIPKLLTLPFFKKMFNTIRFKRKYRRGGYEVLRHLQPLRIMPSQKILDIGCGKGQLICQMFNFGFTNVQGVDKFIDKAYDYGYNVKVFKNDLAELKRNSYDLLMMHHVFEHMENPLEELRKCYDLLKEDSHLIIRIPVVGKAWEMYKQNWVQLDAPRHFFIHTEESMHVLAQNAGFTITNIEYDSNAFQFWGSELYNRGISLLNKETKAYVSASEFFSDQEIANFEEAAKELNMNRIGDQAVFYLKKVK
jgi:SAM-dependent methyltransferase